MTREWRASVKLTEAMEAAVPGSSKSLSPTVQQVFRELKAANRVLIRAMAYEKIARARHARAASAVTAAARNVKLLLDCAAPDLPSFGPELPGELVTRPAISEGLDPSDRGAV